MNGKGVVIVPGAGNVRPMVFSLDRYLSEVQSRIESAVQDVVKASIGRGR